MTVVGLLLTAAALSWGAACRRGYGPSMLVLSAAPLLLASPAVSLLEDFRIATRQLLALKEQMVLLTFAGQVALLAAVLWNASWDIKLLRCYRRTPCGRPQPASPPAPAPAVSTSVNASVERQLKLMGSLGPMVVHPPFAPASSMAAAGGCCGDS